MNKQNKVLLGILAFIVACTVGYALFNENITIIGNATANGSFEITTTCTPGINSEAGVTGERTEAGYKDDSCSVTDNKVTFLATLDYPTATRYFTVKVVNTGTIPIKLKGDTVSESFKGYINGELKNNLSSSWENIITTVLYTKNGLVPDDENGLLLEPNDVHYIVYKVLWPSDINITNFKVEFTTSLPYEQITAE